MQRLATALQQITQPQQAEFRADASANDCPHCSDGWIVEPGSGARQCECLKAKFRQRKLDRIPAIYDGLTLATITPDASRYHRQAELIAALRANPEISIAFTGNLTGDEPASDLSNRTGKSLMGWLLYREAIERGQKAYGFFLPDLLKQFQTWELDPEKMPEVTPFDLQQRHTKYFLLLDELDKARPSEFRAEMLFQLIEAAHSFKHQLVITTNYTLDGLSRYWSRNGVSYGPAIVSRIKEMPGGFEEAMF